MPDNNTPKVIRRQVRVTPPVTEPPEEKKTPPWDGPDQIDRESSQAATDAAIAASTPRKFRVVADNTQPFTPGSGRDPSPAEIRAAIGAARAIARARGWALTRPGGFLRRASPSYVSPEQHEIAADMNLNFDSLQIQGGGRTYTLTDEEKDLLRIHRDALFWADQNLVCSMAGFVPPEIEGGTVGLNGPLYNPTGGTVGHWVRYDFKGDRKKYLYYYGRRKEDDSIEFYASGEPPCDLAPAGRFELFYTKEEQEKATDITVPVALTEGPKAMYACRALAQAKIPHSVEDGLRRLDVTDLCLALQRFFPCAWHGAGPGVAFTDWTAFRERLVYLFPDDDEPGQENMIAVARAISRAGGTPVMLKFGTWRKKKGKDFADLEYVKMLADWPATQRMFEFAGEAFYPPRIGPSGVKLPPKFRRTFTSNWIWVPEAKGFFSNTTEEIYDAETLSRLFPAPGGRTTAARLISDDFKVRAHGMVALPGQPYGIQPSGLFNITQQSPLRVLGPAASPDLPPEFMRVLEGCVPDPVAREAWLQFEADAIAHPDQPPGWALLCVGRPGAGKTSLARFFGSLAGRQVDITVESTLGEFTSPESLSAASIFIEELFDYTGGKGHQLYQRSKALITGTTRQMNIKGKPQFSIKNVVRLRATSNQDNALLLEGDDRRWLVVDFHRGPNYPADFFDRMRVPVYRALLRRGIMFDRLPPTVPTTDAKTAMVDSSISFQERRLKHYLEGLSIGDCVLASDILDEFKVYPGTFRKHFAKWDMLPQGQIKFKRDNDGNQPQASVWMKGPWNGAKLDAKGIAQRLTNPGPLPSGLLDLIRKCHAEDLKAKDAPSSGQPEQPSPPAKGRAKGK